MFFAFPTMRADVLTLAVVLNIYNIIGSILYDRRVLKAAGESYENYKKVTGLILPRLSRPRGAADIPMARPRQWDNPADHLPAFLLGLVIGVFYWFTIGIATPSAFSIGSIAIAALIASAITGIVLGMLPVPGKYKNWAEMQTNISTSVSVTAAVGVVTWGAIMWVKSNQLPYLAAPLPMWFIVQYLGHVFAFFTNGKFWLTQIDNQTAETIGQ